MCEYPQIIAWSSERIAESKAELRVAGYEVRVTGYEVRGTSERLACRQNGGVRILAGIPDILLIVLPIIKKSHEMLMRLIIL